MGFWNSFGILEFIRDFGILDFFWNFWRLRDLFGILASHMEFWDLFGILASHMGFWDLFGILASHDFGIYLDFGISYGILGFIWDFSISCIGFGDYLGLSEFHIIFWN